MGTYNTFKDGRFPSHNGSLLCPRGELSPNLDFKVSEYTPVHPALVHATQIAISQVWDSTGMPHAPVDLRFYDHVYQNLQSGKEIEVPSVYLIDDDAICLGTRTIGRHLGGKPMEPIFYFYGAHEATHMQQLHRGDRPMGSVASIAANLYNHDPYEIEANQTAVRLMHTAYPQVEWAFSVGGVQSYHLRASDPHLRYDMS